MKPLFQLDTSHAIALVETTYPNQAPRYDLMVIVRYMGGKNRLGTRIIDRLSNAVEKIKGLSNDVVITSQGNTIYINDRYFNNTHRIVVSGEGFGNQLPEMVMVNLRAIGIQLLGMTKEGKIDKELHLSYLKRVGGYLHQLYREELLYNSDRALYTIFVNDGKVMKYATGSKDKVDIEHYNQLPRRVNSIGIHYPMEDNRHLVLERIAYITNLMYLELELSINDPGFAPMSKEEMDKVLFDPIEI